MKKKDKKSDSTNLFKKTGFLILWAFLAFVLYARADDWLRTSLYFKIREIYCDPSLEFLKSSSLLGLKGKNLYALDVKAVQRRLQLNYPEISDLKILKRYPDRLLVVVQRRVPQARLNVRNHQVTIDSQGSILSLSGTSLGLPIITGGNFSKVDARVGDRIRGGDLKLALSIIKEFQANADLNRYKITRLNIDNQSEVFFYIFNTQVDQRAMMPMGDFKGRSKGSRPEDLKIIVDAETIKRKFNVLALVLDQTKNDSSSVEYIDLRFKEPIVKKN